MITANFNQAKENVIKRKIKQKHENISKRFINLKNIKKLMIYYKISIKKSYHIDIKDNR